MKKYILSILFMSCFLLLHAQKITRGSFASLAKERRVSVIIDYSESKIDYVPFDVFLESEENWDSGYREILMKFVKAANQSGGGMTYSSKEEADSYKLVFKAKKVDRDGETSGSLVLLDKEGNIVGIADGFNANGGKFGSQMNLMGDAAERLGKKVARFIVFNLK